MQTAAKRYKIKIKIANDDRQNKRNQPRNEKQKQAKNCKLNSATCRTVESFVKCNVYKCTYFWRSKLVVSSCAPALIQKCTFIFFSTILSISNNGRRWSSPQCEPTKKKKKKKNELRNWNWQSLFFFFTSFVCLSTESLWIPERKNCPVTYFVYVSRHVLEHIHAQLVFSSLFSYPVSIHFCI